ncbi:MAG: DUF4160 domain-containing protein [Cytophagales bacterium]|nr:MAG: DUF4160 domain-containing protein [Cytophagales bacterium]
MGKLIIFASYYFFVWAGENPAERLHIHVFRTNSKNSFGAKFWLDDLSLFERGDFTDKELNQIQKDLQTYAEQTRTLALQVQKGEKVKALRINKKGKRQ